MKRNPALASTNKKQRYFTLWSLLLAWFTQSQTAVEGIQKMTEICRTHKMDHEIYGKNVVASKEQQLVTLDELADRGERNILTGLIFVNPAEIKQREPHITAKNALFIPYEDIVSYKAVMLKMLGLIGLAGGRVHFNAKIQTMHNPTDGSISLKSEGQEWVFVRLVNCIGLYSDHTFQ